MQKGSLIGIFVAFVAGMMVMYAVGPGQEGVQVGAEVAANDSAPAIDSAGPIPVTKDDPSWGNVDAPVTIIEISDFQCPFCSRVNPTIAKLKQEYGKEKIRLVWKHNPLPFHKQARPAHEAAATVHALGGDFWKFHDLAFANQKALTPDNIQKWAVASGVDAVKFKAAFAAKKYAGKVDKDLALSRKIGARGTPHFRINGIALSGAQPLPKFKALIDAQLKAAAAMVKAGTKKGDVALALTKTNFKPAEAPKKAERKEDTTVWKIPVVADDPIKGGKDALVTIVEFSDFQCPFCTRVNPTMKKLLAEYKDDIRIVWKDNPLPFHKRAKPAAELARFAFEKGGSDGFWKAHDEIFANQKNLEDAGLQSIATKLGLKWADAQKAMKSGRLAKKVTANLDLGSDFSVRGTPHFFINGRRLSGAQPYAKFKTLVDSRLAIAKALVKKGVARSKIYSEVMKTAKAPAAPEKRDVPAPGKQNPFKGAANAKVVIQEFSDFQCPFCGRVNPTIAQILKTYPNDVKVVWRNMPLPFHKDAPLAAEAAQEAFAQGGNKAFFAFHDKLFTNQKAIKRPELEKYATELGLDLAKFKAALDSHKHKAHIDADVAIAKKAGVSGTPAFTVNGYFVNGAQPFPAFNKVIKLALKGG